MENLEQINKTEFINAGKTALVVIDLEVGIVNIKEIPLEENR